MEDAVKALLIAAGLFIGLMIIALGLVLFSSLSQYADDTQNRIEENALQKFNEQYTKYINCEDKPNAKPSFELTIQDIVTVANIAYENNKNYELTAQDGYNYYVTVKIGDTQEIQNTIKDITAQLLKDNSTKKYKCTYGNVKINPNTGRVYEVIFKEY